MLEEIYQYINQLDNADFEKFKLISGTSNFNIIISEIRAESIADDFRQQCQNLGVPDNYLDTTEKLITLARAVAGRYVHGQPSAFSQHTAQIQYR